MKAIKVIAGTCAGIIVTVGLYQGQGLLVIGITATALYFLVFGILSAPVYFMRGLRGEKAPKEAVDATPLSTESSSSPIPDPPSSEASR
jgi:hypothetical protein